MVVDKEIENILRELAFNKVIHFEVEGSKVLLCLLEDDDTLYMRTSIFASDGFIPKSVLQETFENPLSIFSPLKVVIKVENQGVIYLDYMGRNITNDENHFISLLDEFILLSDQWREFLADKGNDDLLHVTH